MTTLFPRVIDNTFPGHKLALWLFGLLVLLRTVMSVNSIVNGYSVASTADGIPLDAYPPAAAQTIVSLFALLALANLMIYVLGAVALVRYRSMVPLLFALLLLQQLGRDLIVRYLPIVRVGAPPASIIRLVLLSLMIAGLALSLWRRKRGQ